MAIARKRKILLDYGHAYMLEDRHGEQDAIFWRWGWDGYWSRRPCDCMGYGKDVKRMTHHIERATERREIYDAIKDAI